MEYTWAMYNHHSRKEATLSLAKSCLAAIILVILGLTGVEAQGTSEGQQNAQVMFTLTLEPEPRQQPEVMNMMQREVRETVKPDLAGGITQWYWRGGDRGILLVLSGN
ncbi:MAG: hypothetical protein OEM63_08150 [Gammaproteobacteria bacterium]|nr:hypothetical protein [Gammaproteobacteria bacterium]